MGRERIYHFPILAPLDMKLTNGMNTFQYTKATVFIGNKRYEKYGLKP